MHNFYKVSFLLMLCLSCQYSQAQTNVDIGLNIVRYNNVGPTLTFVNTTGNNAAQIIFKNNTNHLWTMQAPRSQYDSIYHGFGLWSYDGTTYTSGFYIRNNGNFGIGTESPTSRLHVNSGAVLFSGSTGNTPTSGAGTRMMWVPAKAAFRAGVVTGSKWNNDSIGYASAVFGHDNRASNDYTFAAGRNNTVTGYSSSALGMNNRCSGDYSFVAGINNILYAGSSGIIGNNNNVTGNYYFVSGRDNLVTGSGIEFGMAVGRTNTVSASDAFAMGSWTKASASNSWAIGSGVSSSTLLENNISKSLMIGFNSNKPTLYVSSSNGLNTTGTVAIATTTIPSTAPTSSGYKFVVDGHSYLNGSVVIGDQSTITAGTTFPSGYKLYVTDGILTEKVKVALKSSTAWADFVFDKDYKLMSLDSVETFIKENKHLPSIPSADEAVKNGVDLLEMDAKLLQKVEELTLYIIEQNKKIEKLQQEMEELKKK